MIDPHSILAALKDPAAPAWAQAILSTISIAALGVLFWLEQRAHQRREMEKDNRERAQAIKAVKAFVLAAQTRSQALQKQIKEAHEFDLVGWMTTLRHIDSEITPYIDMAPQFDVAQIGSPELVSAWTSFRVELARVRSDTESLSHFYSWETDPTLFVLKAQHVAILRDSLMLFEEITMTLLKTIKSIN